MSNNIAVPGTLQPNTHVRLTSTSITDIYTASDNFDVVVAIMCANETAGAVTILVDHYDGSTNFHSYAKSVAANGSELLSDFPIKLLNGHKIRATAGSANAITVSLAIMKTAGKNTALA